MKEKKSKKEVYPKVDKDLVNKGIEATKKLEDYLKKNKLDPTKDYSKDKKHGPKIKELKAIIDTYKGKIKDATPEEQHHKKERKGDKKEKSSKEPKEKKEKKERTSSPKKYDYPLVDGKEMTSEQKKKYRVKMRAEANKKDKGTKDKPEKAITTSKTKTIKKDKAAKTTKAEKKTKKSSKKDD